MSASYGVNIGSAYCNLSWVNFSASFIEVDCSLET
jgi:hypothetical protein